MHQLIYYYLTICSNLACRHVEMFTMVRFSLSIKTCCLHVI